MSAGGRSGSNVPVPCVPAQAAATGGRAGEGTFPHSREVIARTFKDLPESETRKIVAENAARLYGFRLKGLN